MKKLLPSKHSNLKYSIINVAAYIISETKDIGMIRYDELLALLKKRVGPDVGEVFLPSLTFLYMLKRIEYVEQLDSVRLID